MSSLNSGDFLKHFRLVMQKKSTPPKEIRNFEINSFFLDQCGAGAAVA